MAERERTHFLDTPVAGTRRRLITINDDAVGAMAEKVARFFGTGRYLMWQTVVVIVWIALNVGAFWWNWDPYPFILLNLAFSTQAAYAAPLILLAETRQAERDRREAAEDRRRSSAVKADLDYLARELASLRLRVIDSDDLARVEAKLDRLLALADEPVTQ